MCTLDGVSHYCLQHYCDIALPRSYVLHGDNFGARIRQSIDTNNADSLQALVSPLKMSQLLLITLMVCTSTRRAWSRWLGALSAGCVPCWSAVVLLHTVLCFLLTVEGNRFSGRLSEKNLAYGFLHWFICIFLFDLQVNFTCI